MDRIYLDNAATTYPKPPCTAEAVYAYMTGVGANINRGSYRSAYAAEETVYEARRLLCRFFDGPDPRQVVFTKNITESLNVLLKGLLRPGDHVIVSRMEHNAVMRPLTQLKAQGVSFDRAACGPDGQLDLDSLESLIRPQTRAVVMTHASNVSGTVMPLQKVGELCRKKGILFIADTAQTAGVLPVSMEKMYIDALAFTGHKGLMGPQGTGGFLLRKGLEKEMEPLLSGGTGSFSHLETVPEQMPDRFEPGTMNLPGIAGLLAGLSWVEETGIRTIREREEMLTKRFLRGIRPLLEEEKIRLAGPGEVVERTGVVSVAVRGGDNARAAFLLDENYGIMTRVGLHCAPSAHKALGTYPEGTVRFSFGYFNTEEEADRAAEALKEICDGL